MPLRTRKNSISTVDYIKCLRKAKSWRSKVFFHLTKALFYKNDNKKIITEIRIKFGTSENSLPISEVLIIVKSIDVILKNICKALGYDEDDVKISLLEAGAGCFFLKIGLFITQGALQRYSSGLIEGLLNIDLAKEGKRQGECIRDIFESFMCAQSFKNGAAQEAINIKDARNLLFKTLLNNKKIRSINFTNNPQKEISRSNFIDYII